MDEFAQQNPIAFAVIAVAFLALQGWIIYRCTGGRK